MSVAAPRPRRLTHCLLQALAIPAALAVTVPIAWAGCDNLAPLAGQTVTCSAAAPNPQTLPVIATGEAGIIVNVASGAQLQQSGGGSAISLVGAGGHQLGNQGAISSVGGIAVQLGGGSRVDNLGSISTGNNTALQFVEDTRRSQSNPFQACLIVPAKTKGGEREIRPLADPRVIGRAHLRCRSLRMDE